MSLSPARSFSGPDSNAVEIPPEQAIDVAPQGELVAIGAAYLLVLGFFGALAAMGVFLVDRSARPTPGMARALLGLLAIEGMATIVFIDGPSTLSTAIDCELFVLPLAAALLVTMLNTFGKLEDDLRARGRELCDPEPQRGLLRSADERAGLVLGPLFWVAGATIASAVLIPCGIPDRWMFGALTGFWVVFAIWFLALVVRDRKVAQRQRKEDEKKETEGQEVGKKETKPVADPPMCEEERLECEQKRRRAIPRPQRLKLDPWGFSLIFVAMAIGIGLVLMRLPGGDWWVGVSLGVAALIVAALWRVSEQVNKRLVWFGVAVFLSVPLFGTLMTVVKNVAHPKVQPLALIRKTDGPRESIQGLYVTETSSRIYFANIATEGCGEEVVPAERPVAFAAEGEEVVAMSLGPLAERRRSWQDGARNVLHAYPVD